MRNLFFLLLISASSVWAKDSYSQGVQEMFNVKNGTIESIFKQIKKQSHYEFFYNTAVLDVKQNVTLKTLNGTLDEILAQVLGEKYVYQVKDNYVLISERKMTMPDEVKKITIKGVVKDKKGELLPGVSVLLKGTSIGVATDVKGEFILVIPEQDTIVLRFTFIGMRTRDIVYKQQNKSIIVILEDEYKEVCNRLFITTDDGTYGEKGFVTNKLQDLIDAGNNYDLVIAIGPIPMMKFVSKVTEPYNIKTLVSLNPIMIDGTGMCGGCRVTVGGEIKFACVDGPDFDGHQVDYDELMKRNSTYREFEAHDRENCRMYKAADEMGGAK